MNEEEEKSESIIVEEEPIIEIEPEIESEPEPVQEPEPELSYDEDLIELFSKESQLGPEPSPIPYLPANPVKVSNFEIRTIREFEGVKSILGFFPSRLPP